MSEIKKKDAVIMKKEMLKCFDGICQFLALHGFTQRDERLVAIKKLIEACFKWQKQATALWELSPTLEGLEDSIPLKKFVKELKDFDFMEKK